MSKKILKIVIALCVVLFFTAVLEYIHGENRSEIIWYDLNFPQEKPAECVIDIARFGALKYYGEPDAIAVYIRLAEKKPEKKVPSALRGKKITFALENLDATVSQGSKKGYWKRISSGDVLMHDRRGKIRLNLELRYPRENTKRYNVHEGKVLFLAKEPEKTIAGLKVKIINSRYAKE